MTDHIWRYTDAYQSMEKIREGLPPLIICVACNGGVQGKESNENIPETADEIADSVYDAYKAGASMVHIHARDPDDITLSARSPECGTKWQRRSGSGVLILSSIIRPALDQV